MNAIVQYHRLRGDVVKVRETMALAREMHMDTDGEIYNAAMAVLPRKEVLELYDEAAQAGAVPRVFGRGPWELDLHAVVRVSARARWRDAGAERVW